MNMHMLKSSQTSGLASGFAAAALQNCAGQSTDKVPQQSEISRGVAQLDAAVVYLSERIASLEKRLFTVLRVVPPCDDKRVSEPYSTPLGEALVTCAAKVGTLIDAVSSIESRLEV